MYVQYTLYVYIHEKKWMRNKFYSQPLIIILFLFVAFVHCSHISLKRDNDKNNNVFCVKSSTMALPKST